MRRAIVLLVLAGLSVAMWAVGVVMMLATEGVNEIPTPGYGTVGGILAMFGALCVFASGFVLVATEPD